MLHKHKMYLTLFYRSIFYEPQHPMYKKGGDIMKVFEIRLKLFLMKDIIARDIFNKLNSFIDGTLSKDEELLKIHKTNKFKYYCFNGLYPVEKDKVYKQDNIYTLTLRTIDSKLADFFYRVLVNEFNDTFKALKADIKIIPKKHIDKVFSITPVILKTENGYWKNNLTIDDFERRLKENLIKKYNYIMNTKINEDFELYNSIEFNNKKPISMTYKNINLLGDKVTLNIADNKTAQELLYMSIGTGILEMNSRGFGFINYRYL